MINLIPPHGRTALKHEYILRVASLYAGILAGVCIAGGALMIPTYVLTSSQLKAAQSDNREMEVTKTAFDAAAREIKRANSVMNILRLSDTAVTYSAIVEEVVRSAQNGISITTFQGAHDKGRIQKVIVQGVAHDRKSLAQFKDMLEASSMFETASIPISDLARDTDLPFVVTLTLSETPTP